jgi:hypothetical protein
MNAWILPAALAAALQGTNASPDGAAAYETSFRAAFRVHSVAECEAHAKTARPGVEFGPICACVTDKLLAAKSLAELSVPLPDAEATAWARECVQIHAPPPKPVGR